VAEESQTVDTAKDEGKQVPNPVARVVLGYSKKRSPEDRLESLERYVRLWMVMSLVMAFAALAMAALVVKLLYEVRR
jgi:hypothetical protein